MLKCRFGYLLSLYLLLFSLAAVAQNPPVGKIKDPGQRGTKKCEGYTVVKHKIPIEDNYYVSPQNGMLYLVITDEKYYDQIFKKRNDGFAVDVIERNQYDCGKPNQLNESWAHKGTLLPPLFKKSFKKEVSRRNGTVWVPYQRLPSSFDESLIEFNLIILQKKWYCDYIEYTGKRDENWSLLPMGLYRDSISADAGKRSLNLSKIVSHSVSFEKNKTSFDYSRIKPLYDTLNLTDFVIQEIRINAYASVEGSLENNIKLQQARAQSIVDALQSYQKEKVISTINAKENWDDFYRDVSQTPFAYLSSVSKHEVKHNLANDKALLNRLKPLLSKHRKADIDITLKKRLSTDTNDPEVLKEFLKQRIKEEDIEEALFIQQEIFRKIKDQRLPESFIGELEIPKSAKYSSLLNNDLIFKSENELSSLKETLSQYLEFQALMPDRAKIEYNIISLKLRLWINTRDFRFANDVKIRLNRLRKSDLPPSVIARLAMNYRIISANYYHQRKKYKLKNAIITTIYNDYRQTHLTDLERLSLAKYMSYYSRYSLAREILRSRSRKQNASDDILFYYLRLILAQAEGISESELHRVLSRAVERDNNRFCDLFLPLSQGGVTFQLLQIPVIKELYCTSCKSTKNQ